MTETNSLKKLGIKSAAAVYMIGLTAIISYYISKIYMVDLWENERIAITAFIAIAFLISLAVLLITEASILKVMFGYHFILIGTIACIFIDFPFTPFILIPMVLTSVFGIKVGIVAGVSVGCVLLFEENYLYPIYMFGIAPIVIGIASCFAVWNHRKLKDNIIGSVVFMLVEVLYVLFFKHYCNESGTKYETISFAITMIIIGLVFAALANVLGICINWAINKQTPAFYLKKFADDTYPAVMLMKKKSTTLYYHSTEVAELSRLAAKRIDADYELAYLGGLYHDIGKIVGQEYIKEGIKLAERYKLPYSVRNIMVEHNVKSRLPRSKESAIVMLCDTAVSAVEYLKGTMDKKDMSEASIIENALNKRISAGALNKSGLTVEEFSVIKETLLKVKERQ